MNKICVDRVSVPKGLIPKSSIWLTLKNLDFNSFQTAHLTYGWKPLGPWDPCRHSLFKFLIQRKKSPHVQILQHNKASPMSNSQMVLISKFSTFHSKNVKRNNVAHRISLSYRGSPYYEIMSFYLFSLFVIKCSLPHKIIV